ncbi:hypothetical protein BDB01DRAFT_776745 [Pilobolus umbonatus]|nr:hypothetical protein BDB01DRAFT_776745 [Pilobolus umbonatus]
MKAVILAFFTLFVALAAAQSTTFYITQPIQGSQFAAGKNETITWSNGLDQKATVNVVTGTNDRNMKPAGVSFTIDGKTGKYIWKVPSDLPQNAVFALQIIYTDAKGASAQSYSSPFTISGTTGPVVTQSFSSVAASTSSTLVKSTTTSKPPVTVTPTVTPTATPASVVKEESTASAFKAPAFAVAGIVLIASVFLF